MSASNCPGFAYVEHAGPHREGCPLRDGGGLAAAIDTAGHFCGQTQPHHAHTWRILPAYGSAGFVVQYQCAGFAAADEPSDPPTGGEVCPDCGHLWSAHFDRFGSAIDCADDRPEGHTCMADCLGQDEHLDEALEEAHADLVDAWTDAPRKRDDRVEHYPSLTVTSGILGCTCGWEVERTRLDQAIQDYAEHANPAPTGGTGAGGLAESIALTDEEQHAVDWLDRVLGTGGTGGTRIYDERVRIVLDALARVAAHVEALRDSRRAAGGGGSDG